MNRGNGEKALIFPLFYAYIKAMNAIFTILFLACTFLLLCSNPENFLSAMLDGASRAAALSVSLVATYSVWMGLMRIWEKSGVSRGASRLLRPLAKRLLQTDNEEALTAASMNLSVNMLGISGAATPYGVRTAQLLDKTDNAEFSSAMFFVLNATSLQILPSSLVAVRVAMGSSAPTDIILPTLLTSAFSTAIGVALVFAFIRPKKKEVLAQDKRRFKRRNAKMAGAGTQ